MSDFQMRLTFRLKKADLNESICLSVVVVILDLGLSVTFQLDLRGSDDSHTSLDSVAIADGDCRGLYESNWGLIDD